MMHNMTSAQQMSHYASCIFLLAVIRQEVEDVTPLLRRYFDRLKPFQGEGRLRDGAYGQRDEREFVVVARNTVGAQFAALAAAVDDRPLAFLPHPDGDRFHRAMTIRSAVARRLVQMTAPETPVAMVAMFRAETLRHNGLTAMDTVKPLVRVRPRGSCLCSCSFFQRSFLFK
jgi:hypothetical protein